jgi:transcriptional regulator with XRE-family HTH domain
VAPEGTYDRLRTPPALVIFRVAAGLSQRQLAEAAGLARHTVCRLERGKHSPRPETVHALAEALDLPPGDVFPVNDNGRAGNAAEVTTTAGTGPRVEP